MNGCYFQQISREKITLVSSIKMVLGIKTALSLRDQHIFGRQSLEIFNVVNTIPLIFLEN